MVETKTADRTRKPIGGVGPKRRQLGRRHSKYSGRQMLPAVEVHLDKGRETITCDDKRVGSGWCDPSGRRHGRDELGAVELNQGTVALVKQGRHQVAPVGQYL